MTSALIIGILGVVVLLTLLTLGTPIAFAMGAVGVIGTALILGPTQAATQITLLFWSEGTDFLLVAIPLFVFMGQLMAKTDIAADLFRCLDGWIGRYKSGLPIAAVMACGGFGAVTGSSVATVATMGEIVYPEMRRYGYPKRLSAGVLAASGTLGILIPPSLAFIFYGILTDVSIAKLFIAGIVPGIITMALFSIIIMFQMHRFAPTQSRTAVPSLGQRLRGTVGVIPIAVVFAFVIGSLYGGITTPTEAAGIGAIGTVVVAAIMKRLDIVKLKKSLEETVVISTFIFAIIVGGYLISRFFVLTGITDVLTQYVVASNMGRIQFLLFAIVLYLILGAMLDVFGMVILTLPFLYPITQQLGIDPVWFGVFIVVMSEIALITPPVGVNVFVMAQTAPDISMAQIFRGVVPYLIGEFVLIAMLIFWPDIALWMPSRM